MTCFKPKKKANFYSEDEHTRAAVITRSSVSFVILKKDLNVNGT